MGNNETATNLSLVQAAHSSQWSLLSVPTQDLPGGSFLVHSCRKYVASSFPWKQNRSSFVFFGLSSSVPCPSVSLSKCTRVSLMTGQCSCQGMRVITMSCPALDFDAMWSGRPSGCGVPGWSSQSEYARALLCLVEGLGLRLSLMCHSDRPAGGHAHEECMYFIASHKLKALSPEHGPLSAKVTDLPCVCS